METDTHKLVRRDSDTENQGSNESHEKGFALIETLVALVLVALVVVGFLLATINSYNYLSLADQRTTAESLARSQIEYVKDQVYTTNPYAELTAPTGFQINTSSVELETDVLQKVTVSVDYNGEHILTLEGYKINQ